MVAWASTKTPRNARGTVRSCRHGASDARFYTERGIDAVSFGVDGGGQHGDDEYALIPSIAAYYYALKDFLSSPA
jgi:succinyl-diaminopimelate desuccinylase